MLDYIKNISILYIEDEKDILDYVSVSLKKYFKNVYGANDGEDGILKYKQYKPDIIISDIQMPKKNGVDLVKYIRDIDKDTPIVMLTAQQDKDELIELINLNINSYILKPIKQEVLIKSIVDIFIPNYQIQLNENIYLDMKESKFITKQTQILLKPKEILFLSLLYKNKKSTTTYEQIEYIIWKDKIMTQNALKTFIKELRHKLPENIIKNVSRVGYILDIR
ncbi:MAG: response regulator transcription factor [Campylobacterota bacterium]|nr:response regulator transcription factor [Campylobacterota bacterium]